MTAVDLFRRGNVLLEIAHGVLPCLKALGQETGGLRAIRTTSAWPGLEGQRRTVEGSNSGTASSLRPVVTLEGISETTGDVTADMID